MCFNLKNESHFESTLLLLFYPFLNNNRSQQNHSCKSYSQLSNIINHLKTYKITGFCQYLRILYSQLISSRAQTEDFCSSGNPYNSIQKMLKEPR